MTDLTRRESEFLLYTAPDGAVKVGVLFRDETAWLTQKALAEPFGVGVPAINKHLKNIFESGALEPGATISKMEIVRNEGGWEVDDAGPKALGARPTQAGATKPAKAPSKKRRKP